MRWCIVVFDGFIRGHCLRSVTRAEQSDPWDCAVAQGRQVDAARSLAYLLNANLTLSGGCPNPPLTEYFTDQVCLFRPCSFVTLLERMTSGFESRYLDPPFQSWFLLVMPFITCNDMPVLCGHRWVRPLYVQWAWARVPLTQHPSPWRAPATFPTHKSQMHSSPVWPWLPSPAAHPTTCHPTGSSLDRFLRHKVTRE